MEILHLQAELGKQPGQTLSSFCAEMKSFAFLCTLVVLCWTAEGFVRYYINANTTGNWSYAESYCKRVYRNLPVITNTDESQRLQKVLKSDSCWIGLSRSPENASRWLWNDKGNYSYTEWMPGQPLPKDTNSPLDCAVTQSVGWSNFDCSSDQVSIYCYRIIVFIAQAMTWEKALSYCRTRYKTLAYPAYQSDLQAAYLAIAQNVTVWTGLRFVNRQWYWVNKTPLQNTISMPSCPKTPYNCGARNFKKGVWENRSCNEELPFICYW